MKKMLCLILIIIFSVCSVFAYGGYVFKTKANKYGAVYHSDIERLFHCAGDYKAIKQLVAEGAIEPLKAGIKVYVVDDDGGGAVKIRAVGDADEIWVGKDAVESIKQ